VGSIVCSTSTSETTQLCVCVRLSVFRFDKNNALSSMCKIEAGIYKEMPID
jgi:hypothetical protein